jgi:hypothetical protein
MFVVMLLVFRTPFSVSMLWYSGEWILVRSTLTRLSVSSLHWRSHLLNAGENAIIIYVVSIMLRSPCQSGSLALEDTKKCFLISNIKWCQNQFASKELEVLQICCKHVSSSSLFFVRWALSLLYSMW